MILSFHQRHMRTDLLKSSKTQLERTTIYSLPLLPEKMRKSDASLGTHIFIFFIRNPPKTQKQEAHHCRFHGKDVLPCFTFQKSWD